MPFGNPIVGSKNLIREAIQSPGFESGIVGWIIRKDGTAEFLNVVIRGDLQSDNYEPGVSGWKLDRDGTAELLDAIIRGTLQSDNYAPGTAGWKLDENGLAEFAEILINSFGTAGKVEINDGKLQLYDTLGNLVIGMGVDTNAPFFGPYIAMYDVATSDPRILFHIPGPGTTPYIRVLDSTGTGYVLLDPGTGFGASLQLQPVDSGALFSPAVLQGVEAGIPGLPALEIYSPENSTHAAAVRSLIQMQGGYQFRQTSKISVIADDSEFTGPVRAVNLRPVSAFDSSSFTTNVTANYSGVGLTGTVLDLTIPSVISGCVTIHLAARGANSAAGTSSLMSVEVRENNAGGTILRAAQDIDLEHRDANASRFGIDIPLTGLPYTTSLAYYFRVMHKVGGGTGTWTNRRLIVTPEP